MTAVLSAYDPGTWDATTRPVHRRIGEVAESSRGVEHRRC
jgi:hypothetical protein